MYGYFMQENAMALTASLSVTALEELSNSWFVWHLHDRWVAAYYNFWDVRTWTWCVLDYLKTSWTNSPISFVT